MPPPSTVPYAVRLGPVLSVPKGVAAAETPRPDRERDYSRLLFWVTAVFLAVGVAARLTRYLINGALWGDECAVGTNIVNRDFAGLTHVLDYLQTAPILFLWSERVV